MFLLKVICLLISLNGMYSAISVINTNEMIPEMKDHALLTALEATQALPDLNAFANIMVDEFNYKYGQSWQCIVNNACKGSNSSIITHISGTLISFTFLKTHVLLFKSIKSDESSFTNKTFECYINDNCSLNLVKKAFIERQILSYGSNFKIEGQNPGKIIGFPNISLANDTAVWAQLLVFPMVDECMNKTSDAINTFVSSMQIMESLVDCVISKFEPKVNIKTGWRYTFGLGRYGTTYVYRANYNKYDLVFEYKTLYLRIQQ